MSLNMPERGGGLLHADKLVIISGGIKGLRNKFLHRKEAFKRWV